MIRRLDIVIIALILTACGICHILFTQEKGQTALVEINGKVCDSISLASIKNGQTEKRTYNSDFGSFTLSISSDGIQFINSDCPNQLCIKQGKISNEGNCIICLPCRACIKIKGELLDGVTG